MYYGNGEKSEWDLCGVKLEACTPQFLLNSFYIFLDVNIYKQSRILKRHRPKYHSQSCCACKKQ